MNSSSFGLVEPVRSVRHAVVLVGIERVRLLATVLALSAAAPANTELIVTGALRAQMASEIVDDPVMARRASTVGLLSVIGAIFGAPMTELVGELPLEPLVVEALVEGTGPLGQVLGAVQAYERADRLAVTSPSVAPPARLREAYAAAVRWSESVRRSIIAA